MPMRRTSGRGGAPAVRISLAEYGWSASRVAALEHSTLPWWRETTDEIRLKPTPLEGARLGGRDALSTFAQYVGHQAFLRAAGVGDLSFEPGEWAIRRKRGEDVRLVRVRARSAERPDDTAWTACIASAVDYFGVAPVRSLDRAWSSPEAAFFEVWQRIRADAAADLRWLRRSAVGIVRAPGPEAVDALLAGSEGIVAYTDDDAVDVVERAATLDGRAIVMIGGAEASPIRRGSSLLQIVGGAEVRKGSASEIAEKILARIGRRPETIVVRSPEQFDSVSRAVLQILLRETVGRTWLVPESESDWSSEATGLLPRSRAYVVAPQFEIRSRFDEMCSRVAAAERPAWIDSFTDGTGLDLLLDRGEIPPDPSSARLDVLREPKRSFLAALALAGSRLDRAVAHGILADLSCRLELDDLAENGVLEVDSDGVAFASEGIRRVLEEMVPSDMAAGIREMAARRIAEACGPLASVSLLVGSGKTDEALEILERSLEDSSIRDETLDALDRVSGDLIAVSPSLALARASCLVGAGRYESARRMLEGLDEAECTLLLARIERRLGRYSSALALIGDEPDGFESVLLAGELHRLLGCCNAARANLDRADGLAGSRAERARVTWERCLLGLDDLERVEPFSEELRREAPYLARRLDGYLAEERRDFETAVEAARDAMGLAANRAESIDAMLDLQNARFLAGDWDGARHAAREALALVEETEGDRAGGGVLFTLAFLCADDGQWETAQRLAGRLERFYRDAGDDRRLGEIDLVHAQIALGRLDLDAARRHARAVLDCASGDIREAALLILDEADWVGGSLSTVRTSDRIGCLELLDRHRLNVARAQGRADGEIHGAFCQALADWEAGALSGRLGKPPKASTGSEKARLARSMAAVQARHPDERIRHLWIELATAIGVDPEILAGRTADAKQDCEAEMLQRLALAPFPPAPDDLGEARWRYATRNRLGVWMQWGSLPSLERGELDAMSADPPRDWIAVGERAWLEVEGLASWSPDGRRAIAEMFRVRAEHANLRRLVDQDEMTIADRTAPLDGIIGESPAIRSLLERVHRIGAREVPVCIEGESGTGKELVARALHRVSPRKARAFTPVNCAALPENLIESELFGAARGAFTGADRDRAGLIETTDGGTLFLDEIGEMPLAAQAKLLRFLQEGEFRRVGDTTVRTANVRIVAATNVRLERAIDQGSFREDLYYRIKVADLAIPPLRERGGDVILLARHFLQREHDRHRAGPDRFTDEVEGALRGFSWPGNVRELENTIRAAHAIAGDARAIDLDHLPERIRGAIAPRRPTGSFFDEVNHFRRTLIERALAEAGGNQSKAAAALGMSRQALAYQIKELGILVGKKKGRAGRGTK